VLSRAAKQSLCLAGQLEGMDESGDEEERKGSGICSGEKRNKKEKKDPYILENAPRMFDKDPPSPPSKQQT